MPPQGLLAAGHFHPSLYRLEQRWWSEQMESLIQRGHLAKWSPVSTHPALREESSVGLRRQLLHSFVPLRGWQSHWVGSPFAVNQWWCVAVGLGHRLRFLPLLVLLHPPSCLSFSPCRCRGQLSPWLRPSAWGLFALYRYMWRGVFVGIVQEPLDWDLLRWSN